MFRFRSHHIYANIPLSNSRSTTLLVSRMSNEGRFTYVASSSCCCSRHGGLHSHSRNPQAPWPAPPCGHRSPKSDQPWSISNGAPQGWVTGPQPPTLFFERSLLVLWHITFFSFFFFFFMTMTLRPEVSASCSTGGPRVYEAFQETL